MAHQVKLRDITLNVKLHYAMLHYNVYYTVTGGAIVVCHVRPFVSGAHSGCTEGFCLHVSDYAAEYADDNPASFHQLHSPGCHSFITLIQCLSFAVVGFFSMDHNATCNKELLACCCLFSISRGRPSSLSQ